MFNRFIFFARDVKSSHVAVAKKQRKHTSPKKVLAFPPPAMEDFKDVMLSEPPARAAAANNAARANNNSSNVNNTMNVNSSGSRTINQSSKAGQSSSLGADTTGADFSAYKGILLCDRPVDRTQLGAGSYRPSGDGGMSVLPFLPSGKAGLLEDRAAGLPPSLESRSRLEQQRTHVRMETKKAGTVTGVLAKHKRWLRAFANNVKEITSDQKDAEAKRELVRQHIREKEAQKRAEMNGKVRDELRGKALVKTTTTSSSKQRQTADTVSEDNNNDDVEESASTANNNNNSRFSVTDTRSKAAPVSSSSAASNNNKVTHMSKKKKKPVWAMTEEEELDAEFEDSKDLLDFASSLDYNSFAKDLEVKEAMAILQQRVREIAAAQKIDLDDVRRQALSADGGASDYDEDDDDNMTVVSVMVVDSEGVERKVHQRKPRKVAASSVARSQQGGGSADEEKKPGWDGSTSKAGAAAKFLRSAVSSESFAIAEKLLAENPALRQVHSKYSLARMLQQVALQQGGSADTSKNPFANTADTQGIPFAGRLAPPIISSIAPEAGSAAAARDMSTAVGGIIAGSSAAELAASAGGVVTRDTPGQPAVHRRILVEQRKRKDQTQNLPYLYRHPGI